MSEILTGTEDYERRDDVLLQACNHEDFITGLLDGLNVEESDDNVFLSAILGSMFDGVISKNEYYTLKKYIQNKDFPGKYISFIENSRKYLLFEGLEEIDIQNLGIDFNAQLECILNKFKVFDIITELDVFNQQYTLIHDDIELGKLVISNTDTNIYLIQNNMVYVSIDEVITEEGILSYLLYDTPYGVIVFNIVSKKLYTIQGEYSFITNKNGIDYICSIEGKEEILTIASTNRSIRIHNYGNTEKSINYTRFLDIYPENEWSKELYLKILDVKAPTLAEKIVGFDSKEVIFSCRGIIKDCLIRQFGTYIIYEHSFFDADESNYTKNMTSIYSIGVEGVVQEIMEDERYEIISDHNNFIVILFKQDTITLSDYKKGLSFNNISNVQVEKDENHTLISFEDGRTGEKYFYSTKYTEFHVEVNTKGKGKVLKNTTQSYH